MVALPIDPLLPEVLAALGRGSSLVIEAPPGAGKTTRVPPALDEAGLVKGAIWVLEPRRLAARLAARRVAEERGESVGESVGYRVRFEEAAGPKTRILFVTEGLFLRRLLDDPRLEGLGAVVFDEFHERHLDADLSLALVRRAQAARPELKTLVMSATLEAAPIAGYLGAPTLRAEGRRFDVAIDYVPPAREGALDTDVAQAVRRLVEDGLDGDVLVFLPGAHEIRRAHAACAPVCERVGLELAVLHGDLPAQEQDRAIRSGPRKKVILSTNVAETSVTIEGVVAVVDSGLARVASHSPWSGLPTLRVQKISRASAAQRAGRAGRLRPGRCLRLYSRYDHDARPAFDVPEIGRVDLADAVLKLATSGVTDPAAFAWFEPPPSAALEAARALLSRLGALDSAGAPTELGRRMARLPTHPRLARLCVEAARRGVADDGCVIAALLAEPEIARDRPRPKHPAASDLLVAAERFHEAERVRFQADRLRSLGFDVGATLGVDRVRKQLARELRSAMAERFGDGARSGSHAPSGKARGPSGDASERALLGAVLAAYPDRVARRRTPGSRELVLSAGGSARLDERSVVDGEWLVAVDAEERGEKGRAGTVLVRRASEIDPDWLLDMLGERLSERVDAVFDPATERVMVTRRLLYDQLALDEERGPARLDAASAPKDAIAHALAEAARTRGVRAFDDDPEALDRFLGRVAFVRAAAPELALPDLGPADLETALDEACREAVSFAELRANGLLPRLAARLDQKARRALEELAPERLSLAGGRAARVVYTPGQPPSLASRLQDFFGMHEGPKLARGRVPVTLHLLAPNQREVQVTSDLAGFWDRHYPALRRQLMRRYPKHAWPEDPRTARAKGSRS